MPRHRHSRRELLDVAWEVAANYRAHDAYRTEGGASRALERRCPGFTARQYLNAFRKALALYDTAMVVVARHADVLWKQTGTGGDSLAGCRNPAGDELRRLNPGFRVSTIAAALRWVFFWHHQK
jgi:hypothetical protein